MTWREQTWVEDHSPYDGGAYATHLIIAGIVNPDNDFDLWIGPEKLSKRCHCSVATLRRQLRAMVEDGYLELLDGGGGRGKIAHYRFVQKPSQNDQVLEGNLVTKGAETYSSQESVLLLTKEETKESSLDSEFGSFYAVYPRHTAPQAAKRAYVRARKQASAEELLAGAQRYRDDPKRNPDFTAHPATWLNGGRWVDEEEVALPAVATARRW